MRRKIDLIVLLVILIIGVFGVKNAVAIGDWVFLKTHQPSEEIVKLAESAGMSDEGKRLFYRFSPELVDQADLDKYCDIEKLGCTDGNHIYILKASTQEDTDRNIVTAAHEMLHVAYSRLGQTEKDALEQQLNDELNSPNANSIKTKLKDYPQEDYYNEAHSFIGSEVGQISPQLEDHYRNYFNDRTLSTRSYKSP